MTSKIVVNNIEADSGISSVTFVSKVNLAGGITGNFGSNNIGINTDNPIKTLDVRGEATFGEGITTSDLDWGTDTNQRVYTFSGSSSGGTNPADGVVAVVNPNTNPSNTRIGAVVFGNKVVGTANTTSNPGIKVSLEGRTNTNIAQADDTGGYLNILTKPDGAELRLVATFNSNGHFLQNHQPRFEAYNGPADTTGAVLVFGTTAFNTGGHYSTTTGRFTAPVAGHYWFFTNPYRYSTIDDGIIVLRVNGNNRVESRKMTTGATGWMSFNLGVTVYLNVGDYVDVYAQNKTHCNSTLTRFSGFLVG